MANTFDAYHRWLGIPPEDQPPNHYRLLGISLFEKLPEVIESAADQRMVHLRSFQTGPNADESQKLLNEVSAARLCLLKADTKTRYDRVLKAKLDKQAAAKIPPAQSSSAANSATAGTTKAAAATPVAATPVAAPLAAESAAAPESGAFDFINAPQPASADWRADAMRVGTSSFRKSTKIKQKSPAPMLIAMGVPAALIAVGLVVAVAMNSKSNDSASSDASGSNTDMAVAQPNFAQPKKIKELHPGESGSKESPKFSPLTNPPNPPSSHKTGPAGSSDPRIGGSAAGTNHEAKKVEGPESELADVGISAADLARRQKLQLPADDGSGKSTGAKNPSKNPSSGSSSSAGNSGSSGSGGDSTGADGSDVKPKPTLRRPVPDEAAQQKSLQQLKDLLKDDFAGAKTPDAQVALADKLKQLSIDTKNDPSASYVMFNQALEFAIKGGDPTVAMAVIDALAKSFDVDAWDLRQKTLAQLAHAAKAEDVRALVVHSAIELAQQAIGESRFEIAAALATTAMNLSAAVKDNALRDEARDLGERTKRMQKDQPALEAALAKLKTNPNDADANLTIGRFKCFLLGDWAAGLPYLSKGNDDALKALAKQEETSPANADEQAKLADAWWDQSEKKGDRNDPMLKAIRARALYWYRLALPNLTGLALAKAQKRVEGDEATKPEAPITETVYLDDLPELDLTLANPSLGKHGETGYSHNGGRPFSTGGGKKGRVVFNPGSPPPPQRVTLGGVEPQHALSLQPRPSGNATVAYDVGGKYRLFNGTAALMDTANPTSAVLFRVLADGRPIWVSRPMRRAGESQTCTVKIAKAKKLEFEILCNGSNGGAFTVWVNPAVGR
jgi:uncharacterized membrane protein YgcG